MLMDSDIKPFFVAPSVGSMVEGGEASSHGREPSCSQGVFGDSGTGLRIYTYERPMGYVDWSRVPGRRSPVSRLTRKRLLTTKTLAAGIAHHYNNLFMGLQGYVALLAADQRLPPDVLARVEYVQRLIQSGSCFPIRFLEYLKNGAQYDPFGIELLRIVHFCSDAISGRTAAADERECQQFLNGITAGFDALFVTTLVGAVCRNYTRLFDAVGSLLRQLERSIGDPEAVMKNLRLASRLVRRGREMTDRLSTYALDTPARSEPLSIYSALSVLCERFGSRNPCIRVQCRPFSTEVRVKADRGQIDGIFRPLFQNAVDAMPLGGTLTVDMEMIESSASDAGGCAASADAIIVRVRDTGEGMTPSTVDRIFDPFFTTKADHGHQGLGLSAVYGHLRSLRGDIRVDSTLGVGTQVCVCLPAQIQQPVYRQPTRGCDASAEDWLFSNRGADAHSQCRNSRSI
jgi:signal transduction histidine kinase